MLQPEQHAVAGGEPEPPGCGRARRPSSGAGQESTTTSAPPRATTPPSTAVISGSTSPYSGRGANSTAISTSPPVHSSARTSSRGAVSAERVRVVDGARGERVGDGRGARRRRPRRLDQHRLVDVATSRLRVRVHRPHRPVPGGRVEQPAEHRGRVETWRAQPVDRAVAADQGAGRGDRTAGRTRRSGYSLQVLPRCRSFRRSSMFRPDLHAVRYVSRQSRKARSRRSSRSGPTAGSPRSSRVTAAQGPHRRRCSARAAGSSGPSARCAAKVAASARARPCAVGLHVVQSSRDPGAA